MMEQPRGTFDRQSRLDFIEDKWGWAVADGKDDEPWNDHRAGGGGCHSL